MVVNVVISRRYTKSKGIRIVDEVTSNASGRAFQHIRAISPQPEHSKRKRAITPIQSIMSVQDTPRWAQGLKKNSLLKYYEGFVENHAEVLELHKL